MAGSAPFGWTSALGAVDVEPAGQVTRVHAPAVWDAAFATYSVVSREPAADRGRVFLPSAAPLVESGGKVIRALDVLRLAAVPAPPAWWLLISGIVALVGVARRRTV
jgi:hypothetical protein